jgi:hypothetical protein
MWEKSWNLIYKAFVVQPFGGSLIFRILTLVGSLFHFVVVVSYLIKLNTVEGGMQVFNRLSFRQSSSSN